jgi:Spy/CpxP family protein refolding chaperone
VKSQRNALHQKHQSQVESVLTPSQKEELAQMKNGRKENGQDERRMGKGNSKAGRGDYGQQAAFFKKELNLSADQEMKLKGIFQEFQSKAKELRSNTGLTETQRREQLRTLSNQYMEQGKTVLNVDQLKKMDELKNGRKDKLNRNL